MEPKVQYPNPLNDDNLFNKAIVCLVYTGIEIECAVTR